MSCLFIYGMPNDLGKCLYHPWTSCKNMDDADMCHRTQVSTDPRITGPYIYYRLYCKYYLVIARVHV